MQYYQKHTITGLTPLTWNFLLLRIGIMRLPLSTNALSLIDGF